MYCISDPNAANQALSNLDQLEFFGLPFYYNSEYTLIPRFDTEVLVRHVLKCVPEVDRVIDIGTGSGIIITSLRYFWPKNIKTPIFGASDIQHSILELAQKNLYKNYCMDVELRQGSLLDPWINTIVKGARILLVANLPYIANNDPEVSVDVLENEPHTALFGGGEDGLELYRSLLSQITTLPDTHWTLCFEIGHTQGPKLQKILQGLGASKSEILHDLAGLPRCIASTIYVP